jgi:hypothetical protein
MAAVIRTRRIVAGTVAAGVIAMATVLAPAGAMAAGGTTPTTTVPSSGGTAGTARPCVKHWYTPWVKC